MDAPADGSHLTSAADVPPNDDRVFVVAGGRALLTSVYLDDPPRPPRRRRGGAPRGDGAAGSQSSASSSEDEGDEDTVAALRAAGLPTSFTGSGAAPRRRPRRDEPGQRRSPPATTALMEPGDVHGGDRPDLDKGDDAGDRTAPPSSAPTPPTHARPRTASARKYWRYRHALWSAYDAGVAMDDVGWFSATPEALARHHAARCAVAPGVVVDAFAGCGGNAVRFAQRAGVAVVAVELDGGRAAAALHNARAVAAAAGAASPSARAPTRLDAIAADFLVAAPALAADAVFLSPPWGGPAYTKTADTPFDVEPDVGGCGAGLAKLVSAAATAHAPGAPLRVAAFLPRTARIDQCAAAAPPGAAVEIERAVVGGRVKGVTVYYGEGARQL